ncbi:MAG: hypothetical protein AMXMBFR53_18550 [Gemmatimonadota bacterium]
MTDLLSQLLAEAAAKASRRKCFISYYSGDADAVDRFLADYSDVFIPKAIGVSDGDDFIDSSNSEYVMSRIREKYLGDSTVTLCLLGECTHSRRYVDWELKTTLRRGAYTPNGLVGILLPHMGDSGILPPRFKDNWNADESKAYAIYRPYPTTKEQLRGWIEDAYARRTTHAALIANAQEMMKYSRKCQVHGVTH